MHLLILPDNDKIKKMYENHSSFYEGDAGLDLFTPETITVPPRSLVKINTGIKCEALKFKDTTDGNKVNVNNVSYFLYPRSSIVKTPLRMANSVGIIDAGYRGNIIGCFDNITDEAYVIEEGTRLLQICAPNLEPIQFELVTELSETTRGSGGYGSTGN